VIPLFAVIPSCCRLQELTNLVKTLVEDGVHVIIVNTGYDTADLHGRGLGTPENPTMIICDDREPKNISRWWNVGLDMAESWNKGLTHYADEPGDFVVAVLNDDIKIQKGFVRALSDAIFGHDAAAAAPDVWGWHTPRLYTKAVGSPMPGFAFALRGSKKLRADESLVWWYGDNDLSWQAMEAGGLVTVPGLYLEHLYPNSTTTGELAEQAGRDRETFREKWGRNAW
jgi:hypothetical protein